jgi:hypothetical protein
MNRSRSRSRSRGHGGGGGGGHRQQGGGNSWNRSFDSTGPDVKIRGNASHVYEKYLQLARDAHSSGDRVMAENYLQHAEHYFRIIQSMGPPPGQQQQPQQQGQQQPNGGDGRQGGSGGGQQGQPYPQQASSGPSFGFGDQPGEPRGAEEAEA